MIADAADELARKSEPYGRPLGPLPRRLQDRARDKKSEVETTAPSSRPLAEPADAADELARKSGPLRRSARPLPYVPRRLQHPVRDKEPEIGAEAATNAPAEYTAADSHFGRKWLWRAASATS